MTERSHKITMARATLRRIIAQAADEAGCEPEDRKRLMAAADNTDRVAVGAYHRQAERCDCPVTRAGYMNVSYDDTGVEHDVWAPDVTFAVRRFTSKFDSVVDSHTYLTRYVEIQDEEN